MAFDVLIYQMQGLCGSSSESTDRSSFTEISIVEVELWRQNLPGVHHPFDLEGKIQITPDAWPISSNIELPLINRILDI